MKTISPDGAEWAEYKKTLLSPEERQEIDLKVQLICAMIDARNEQGITQKKLE